MPRLEIGSGPRRAFREIAVSGSTVITRSGDADTDGQAGPPLELDSPEDARAEAARLIAEARDAGYEPIDDGPGEHERNPEIEDAIIASPDDDAGYLVYGDWLQAAGDPRGELVMLQHKLTRKPHDRKLRRAEQEFHRRHWHRMLPPRLREQSTGPAPACWIDWRCGFIHRVRLARTAAGSPYTVRELLAALLEHPSAALLQELAIGPLGPEPPHDLRPVVETLCAMAPAPLRVLELVDDDVPDDVLGAVEMGDATGLLARLPRLERLHLRAGAFELRPAHAPALRSLSVSVPLPSDRADAASVGWLAVRAIADSRWPALETLALHGDDASPLPIDALEPLLHLESGQASGRAGDRAPALRHLAITHTPNTAHVLSSLWRTPLLDQLETLDLSAGALSDGDVPLMTSLREGFAHLRELHLERNCISAPRRAEVRELCVTVLLDNQRGAGADSPQLAIDDVHSFAPDYRSILAARDYADSKRWVSVAQWNTVLWGSCRGTELYDVFVDVADVQPDPSRWEAGCTCPSAKNPCKHALALLYMAVRSLLPVAAPPEGFIERCRASRYDD